MRVPFQLFLFTLAVNLMFGLVTMSYPGFNNINEQGAGDLADTSVWSIGDSTNVNNDYGNSWGTNSDMSTPKNNPIAYTLSTIGAQNLNISQSSTGSGYVTSGSGIGGLFNSVFDLNNVFLISKIANLIYTNLFGLPILIQAIFGPYLGTIGSEVSFMGIHLWSPLQAVLTIVVVIIYALGIAWFWTGRNVVRESL